MNKEFETWCDRLIVAESLSNVGLNKFSPLALNFSTEYKIINRLISIIKRKATINKRQDVLDQLCAAGLIG